MEHEKIIAKGKYIFEMELESPLSIGSAASEFTDHDVLRTIDNIPFIPATSIAGPIRTFCNEYFGKGKSFFAMDIENQSLVSSPFLISDGTFSNESKVKSSSRDGIAITGYNESGVFEKTPKKTAKYDYEIIQKGSIFTFVIEYTLREKYKECFSDKFQNDSLKEDLQEIERQIQIIAKAFNEHLISFGFKKNRGLGNVKVNILRGDYFFGDTLKKYLDLKDSDLRTIDFDNVEFNDANQLIIECPVKLDSPLSIRAYSDNLQDDFDFTQISFDNDGTPEAIIPGSSLIGALRHQMEKIEHGLKLSLDLNQLFGSVDKKETYQSKIKTEELYLKDGCFITSTRTSLDRFTGSALNAHLFTQRIYINKKDEFTLSFQIVNDEKLYPQIGLFLLALNDLKNGYCPLGGSTAIGYGIIKSEKQITVNGQSIDINQNDFIGHLYRLSLNGEAQ